MTPVEEPIQAEDARAAEPEEGATANDGAAESSIERLLAHVPSERPQESPAPALRTARVTAVHGREVEIAYRRGAAVKATLDEGVDPELVRRALAGDERVLVEIDPDVGPIVVGVVQTRIPDVLEIKARKVVLDADEELLMRAGRGAMRIREDGDVELVGSRISTLSRGLFRIVGRVLRLN